jgi:hypothetical protein
MKNLYTIAIAFTVISCGVSHHSASHKPNSPKVYTMSQKDKEDVNFDLRENKKLVAKNLKEKNHTQHTAALVQKNYEKELAQLNKNSSKNKKEKVHHHQVFDFYHH